MTKKIILLGCGNVGSRHLQALANLPFDIEVSIVEPNKKAQELGKTRLNEVIKDEFDYKFLWYDSINELSSGSDLGIVATTSVGKVEIINQLIDLGIKRFLVEKIVCQSTEQYNKLLSVMKSNNAKGWVNTNLRCFQAWQKIKEFFQDSDIIHQSIIASNTTGPSTNAIHYVDLFSFLTEDYNVKLNGDLLLNQLFPNKRGSNFKEFGGTIVGTTKNGSTLTMTFLPNSNIPNIINIAGIDNHIFVDEFNEKGFDLAKHQPLGFKFKFEHVSTLTTKIATDILNNDDCILTSLQDSYTLHNELFRIFNQHIKKITNQEPNLCPIT